MTFHTIDPSGQLPQLEVSIDFTNDPTNSSRVWTDVTTDVRQINYLVSGRNQDLQRSEAGTLNATLNNRHGNYDPLNTASPYYPGVKRMRWIRVNALWGGVTYNRWQGLIEVWRQTWPSFGRDAIVELSATDVFKILNLFDLQGRSYAQQRTDLRIDAVMSDAGFAGATHLNAGESSCDAIGPFATGSDALTHVLDVTDTENGYFYALGDGTFRFEDRWFRATNPLAISSVATVGDSGAANEIPYREASFDLDDQDVWNEVGVTPVGGTVQVASNATSLTQHFRRRLDRSLLNSSTSEALSAAQYLSSLYGNPPPRLPSLELIGQANTGKWPQILSGAQSQRITWKRRANQLTGNTSTISQDMFIERYADMITPSQDFKVTWQLSAAVNQSLWKLDDPVLSVLDTSTKLAY